MLKFVKLLAVFVLMTSTNAYSQIKNKLYVNIDGFDIAADKCNVQKQTILTPAILTLRNNKIQYTNENTFPYLYIHTNLQISSNSSSCIYSVTVEIIDEKPPEKRNGFKSYYNERISLCRQGAIGGGALNILHNEISNAVERSIKSCLTEVDY